MLETILLCCSWWKAMSEKQKYVSQYSRICEPKRVREFVCVEKEVEYVGVLRMCVKEKE